MEDPIPSRPTLDDVARALGVSRTTVSNAFNRPDQLSSDLRERVLETARLLGYAGPHPAARMLRTGRAGAVGLVFGGSLSYAVEDPAAVALLRGVARACEAPRLGLLILPAMGDGTDRMGVGGAAVDGFILYALPDDAPILQDVRARRLPTVVVDDPHLPGLPAVGIDDRAAARQAAEHLLALGHRRVGILAFECAPDRLSGAQGPAPSGYRTANERLAGYADALRAAGIDPAGTPVEICMANDEALANRAASALLSRTPRPTAILAMSDRLALGALAAAREQCLTVPGDLSVVGFDDIAAAATADPPLTTIRQPLVEKGELAARLLLDGGDARRVLLPTELVVRGSTGPARG